MTDVKQRQKRLAGAVIAALFLITAFPSLSATKNISKEQQNPDLDTLLKEHSVEMAGYTVIDEEKMKDAYGEDTTKTLLNLARMAKHH
ncbi:hypothetical protein OZL92_05540 [Bacillus sonorensis]|uniref:Uncharacterized protein n=2 Tax=Bacillus sonorensis TaxID=119858 RepID=M5P9Y6_9BACI|nr:MULTISPECIES: hypothetical protein [Bacillus]TWK82324.1 hypothetical protein CHCC20335_3367 [Bacillus paralicheniformis]ASB88924.1 hypothetical protein S101395_02417 [Bacillus sonorensis]EME76268.1 hypothetical protein BSONL12_00747 [Bacillus sonorensis L12]MCZ0072230.1 hypothetical protein [Bacillus sonorensis]MCZ0090850.1 hypothetical protein [Bacillus sonorensis]